MRLTHSASEIIRLIKDLRDYAVSVEQIYETFKEECLQEFSIRWDSIAPAVHQIQAEAMRNQMKWDIWGSEWYNGLQRLRNLIADATHPKWSITTQPDNAKDIVARVTNPELDLRAMIDVSDQLIVLLSAELAEVDKKAHVAPPAS